MDSFPYIFIISVVFSMFCFFPIMFTIYNSICHTFSHGPKHNLYLPQNWTIWSTDIFSGGNSTNKKNDKKKQNKYKMKTTLQSLHLFTVLIIFASLGISSANGRVAFEKLTDYDFSGSTYYSVKNFSLYECEGWCRDDPNCQAAAFSFVVNPLTPAQETLCQLQNDSNAHNPNAVAQRSASMYYMVKLQVWINKKSNYFFSRAMENFRHSPKTLETHPKHEKSLYINFPWKFLAAKRQHLHATMGLRACSKQNHPRCRQCADLH